MFLKRFCAYDQFDKVIRTPEWLEQHGFALGVNGKMVRLCAGDDFLALMDHWMTPLMYLGVKDKNGVELREGDILDSGTKAVTPWVVVWKPLWGKACLKGYKVAFTGTKKKSGDVKNRRAQVIWFSIQKASRLSIIGNIHTNPELIHFCR